MALRRAADSLAVRVVFFSSLWVVAAFLVIGGLVSSIYEATAVSGLRSVVRAHLYSLVNSVSVDEDGRLAGAPDLGDLDYSRPLSGWYWEVIPVGEGTSGRLSSFSLGPAQVEAVSPEDVPFDIQYQRSYAAEGLDGERLHVEEAEIVLDPGDHVARFRVMGNASLVDADVASFNRRLALYFGLFGLGSIFVNAMAILYGLRPLKRVRRALGEVRAGRAERLVGPFPTEIRPLATEMNALIDNNRRVVERARTQVGNLAHSLKTPIAVLTNEAGAIGGDKGRLVGAEAERMRVQVQHYLDRARLAALGEGSIARTPVSPSLERLAKVIGRLNPGLDLEVKMVAADLVFAGEREDFEELAGNLLDNAAKWGRGRIMVSAAPLGEGRLRLTVEDDGPGLSQEQIAEATQRGRRLDEAKPGSGLGLSIVSDTIAQYRGEFRLARSVLGGLKAEADLPRAGDENIS
ncbi:ATP-binding protein [Aureimonas populi]|uniref:histidine kinase n=1 Tax=Aureimonas populi TaxID=1701758 RepID=A0ABW5CK83_9HYPH|nr:ATP-binding protein [Aureimonas populi]